LKELKELREKVKTTGLYYGDIFKRLNYLSRIKKEGIDTLMDSLSREPFEIASTIASAIEWGFGEIDWQLQQQTKVLRSIDDTLKTPRELRANERRKMAEELRRRGLLYESEESYLTALELNPKDYRIYVGLAETYLQSNQFDNAKMYLEESLPYAPKSTPDFENFNLSKQIYNLLFYGRKNDALDTYLKISGESRSDAEKAILPIEREVARDKNLVGLGYMIFRYKSSPVIDYQSHSLRLIGHIYACEERYPEVLSTLRSSVELSPCHLESIYDIAQYFAMTGNASDCIFYLLDAILAEPLYYYLARKERNFDPVRTEVEKLLSDLSSEASRMAKDTIEKSESVLKEAIEAVSKAKQASSLPLSKAVLTSNTLYENAEAKLRLAKDKVATGDYVKFLEAKLIADESCALAVNSKNIAFEEREYYQRKRVEKVKKIWESIPLVLLWPLIGLIIGGISGCTTGCTIGFLLPGKTTQNIGAIVGSWGGGILGIIVGIVMVVDKIRKDLSQKG